MAGSALLGEPPATHDDALVYKALLVLNGTGYFPVPTESFVTNRPADIRNGGPLLGAIILFMILVVLLTTARAWAQRYRKKRHITFLISDIFLFFAASTAITYDSTVLYMYTHLCVGRHINYCTYRDLYIFFLLLDFLQSIFYFAVYCAKLSVICLLRGAVEHTVRWWNLAIDIFVVIVAVLGVWSLVSTICTCVPVPAYFSLLVRATTNPNSVHCLSAETLQAANRGLHIATDLGLFLLPLYLVWRMSLSWKRKILFILPFTFGLVTISASILRNIEMVYVITDVTWQFTKPATWDFIDINFSAMLTSMPFIMPLIDRAMHWFHQRSQKSTPGDTSTYLIVADTEVQSVHRNDNPLHNLEELSTY